MTAIVRLIASEESTMRKVLLTLAILLMFSSQVARADVSSSPAIGAQTAFTLCIGFVKAGFPGSTGRYAREVRRAVAGANYRLAAGRSGRLYHDQP